MIAFKDKTHVLKGGQKTVKLDGNILVEFYFTDLKWGNFHKNQFKNTFKKSVPYRSDSLRWKGKMGWPP